LSFIDLGTGDAPVSRLKKVELRTTPNTRTVFKKPVGLESLKLVSENKDAAPTVLGSAG